MKNPLEWFQNAQERELYSEEMLDVIIQNLEQDDFDIDSFVDWILRQVKKAPKEE